MTVRFHSNASSVISTFQKYKKKPEERVRKFIIEAIDFIHEGVTDRTPVHTGESLRNWQWTKGAPYGGKLPDPGGVAPGPTNSMPLGTEPRRPAAQADSDASKDSLDLSDPFDIFYLTNNSDDIIDLEFGRLPSPDRSRSPAGMVRVTVAEFQSIMRGLF